MATDAAAAQPGEQIDAAVSASWAERLSNRADRATGPEDAAEISAFVALLSAGPAMRRRRRQVASGRRAVDRLRTARRALRRGGELDRVSYRAPERRPRRLLLLIDVSASMERYVDRLLRLAYALLTVVPLTVEVFTLGTRLTRVTSELSNHDHVAALRAVDRSVRDRDGGTLLATLLEQFLAEWSGRRACRSAITVVMSDGWAADWQRIGEPMERLARLARRVIWLNPDAGSAGFTDFAPGLSKVRPFVDDRIDGHSLAAVEALAERIAHR